MIKVLSLRQPWAWLVVRGPKRVENRRWPTHHRGRFLIHAAKGMTLEEYREARTFARRIEPTLELPLPSELDRGGIVGVARIVACHPPGKQRDPWHMSEQFGFVLADVAAVPFVPCRGMLGFWTFEPPPDLASWLGDE